MEYTSRFTDLCRALTDFLLSHTQKRRSRRSRSVTNAALLRIETLEKRILLAVTPFQINLSGGPGGIDLFGANAGGDIQNYFGGLSTSSGATLNTLNTVNNPGQNNRPPVAVDDTVATDEETVLMGNLLAANPTTPDHDPDGDAFSVFAVNGVPGNVGTQIALASGALLTVNANGTFTYDPNGQFEALGFGETAGDPFNYTIQDRIDLTDLTRRTDTATTTVLVNGVNDQTTATNLLQTQQYTEDDLSVAIDDIVVADPDAGEIITATLTIADTTTGALTANDGATYDGNTGQWTITGTAPMLNLALANVEFNPAPNNGSNTTLAVDIRDGLEDGVVSLPGTITLNVTPVNDPLAITFGDDQTVDEDAGGQSVLNFTTNFLPGGGADEAGQMIADFIVSNDNNGLFSVQPDIDNNSQLTFTPTANAVGIAMVTVQVRDDGGTANGGIDMSSAQTFMIAVNAINDAPAISLGDNQTVDDDAGLQSVLNFATNFQPGGGTDEAGQMIADFILSNDNNGLFSTQPDIDNNGQLTFSPVVGTVGTATVTVQVQDDGGTPNGGMDTSLAQTFMIEVIDTNQPPSLIIAIPATDQRGFPRVVDGDGNGTAIVDVGAFEFGNFVVNTTGDAVDATPLGDGIVDVDLVTPGNQITLRAAIQESNALAGDNTIFLPAGTYTLSLAGFGEDVAATGDLDVTDECNRPPAIAGFCRKSLVFKGLSELRLADLANSRILQAGRSSLRQLVLCNGS